MNPFVSHFVKACSVIEFGDEVYLVYESKDYQLTIYCSNTGIPFIEQTDMKMEIRYKKHLAVGMVSNMEDAAQICNVITDNPKWAYEILYEHADNKDELVAIAMQNHPKPIIKEYPRYNRYTSNEDFRAEFVELLVNDDDLVDRLIELADFQVNGHDCREQTDDHPNSDCDDCYSGDTEFEMAHILDSSLASIWKATRDKVDPNWATKQAASDGED